MIYVVIILRCMYKLLIIDIDGVLTNGCKTYDIEGNVISKKFNDKDFTAIKRFKNNLNVCFLTADDRVNRKMASSRKIDFYYTRDLNVNNKVELLDFLLTKYNVCKDEVIYIGDDLPDYKIIKELTYTYCPSDAINLIKNTVKHVLSRPGGAGVIAELYDNIYNE